MLIQRGDVVDEAPSEGLGWGSTPTWLFLGPRGHGVCDSSIKEESRVLGFRCVGKELPHSHQRSLSTYYIPGTALNALLVSSHAAP